MRSEHMKHSAKHGRGFTLVELLVVLTIIVTLVALIIPRVRSINRERGIREASRVVASSFAAASQQARIDGVAGILLRRNPNFIQSDAGDFQFAVTEVGILRRVPNYTGDDAGAAISNVTLNSDDEIELEIPMPLEQVELDIVQAGDSIAFNSSSVEYRIISAQADPSNPTRLDLVLSRGGIKDPITCVSTGYLPVPTDGATFVIRRVPRLLRSSVKDLPQSYMIDLRLSGFEVLDNGLQLTQVFEPVVTDFEADTPPFTLLNYDIAVVFDGSGGVSDVFYQGFRVDASGNPSLGLLTARRVPLGPLYLFVTESPNEVGGAVPVASSDNESLWVSVSNITGATTVGFNNAAPTRGQTYGSLTGFYNMDRDEFNLLIEQSRSDALTVSANN